MTSARMGLGSSKDESRQVYNALRPAGISSTPKLYTTTSESFLGEFMQATCQNCAGHEDTMPLAY